MKISLKSVFFMI